ERGGGGRPEPPLAVHRAGQRLRVRGPARRRTGQRPAVAWTARVVPPRGPVSCPPALAARPGARGAGVANRGRGEPGERVGAGPTRRVAKRPRPPRRRGPQPGPVRRVVPADGRGGGEVAGRPPGRYGISPRRPPRDRDTCP